MNNNLNKINQTLIMGPGPSSVSPNVYKALSTYTVGHLDKRFLDMMDETKEMLREMHKTKNNLTLPVSGTGTAAMESCFVNLIEEGEISLAFESASGLDTAVRDVIPTEVWNWMSNVWAGNKEA